MFSCHLLFYKLDGELCVCASVALGKQVDTCLCEAPFTLAALSHRNTELATNVQAYLVLLNLTLLQYYNCKFCGNLTSIKLIVAIFLISTDNG